MKKLQNKTILNDYLIIQGLREPVEMVLSGYNYHKSGNELPWTNKSLLSSVYGDMNTLECYCNPLKISLEDLKPPFVKMKNNSLPLCRQGQGFVLNPYMLNYEKTVFLAYNYYNISYGLFLEFVRYISCVWPTIYQIHQSIPLLFQNYYIMPFEGFRYNNYSRAIENFLNALGVKPDFYFNNSNLYAELMKDNFETFQDMNNSKYSYNHIMYGKYDIYMQRNILLENIEICKKLKKATLLLGYRWQYLSKC